jgi:CBS domain-containing protein
MESSDPISSVLQHKNPELWTIGPETTVYDAIELMADKNIGSLLVLEGGKLCGMLSERDYTRGVILKQRTSRQTPVREIMSTQVVTVTPSDTVEHCMKLMTDRRIRHIPVLAEGKVAGIVSIGDLVKWIISAQEAMIDHLENFIKGSYPA